MTVALAVVIAAAVAAAAYRAGALTRRGAVAATLVGGIALAAGVAWGVFLIGWFVASSALTRLGRAAKARRTDGVVDKGGTRDATQVFANGGVFAAAAAMAWSAPTIAATLASLLPTATAATTALPESLWRDTAALMGAAALAAAGADTAATEIGTLVGGTPWSLRTRQKAAPGMSGAVSVAGTLALVGAAVLLALFAVAVSLIPAARWPVVAWAAVAGAVADSLLGAWVQARRRCPACDQLTEQPRHRCGVLTTAAGGLPWVTNDTVNALCTLVGAAVALRLA